ncbi:Uncharacterized protein dnm_099940 [Desulfonema magnum]|uniref:Uncharacterized protein n=1 Tax=Desulfonema magnum TaxID=45655 RepID=A0A975BY30_9BACT|nr:Uncharacterized protein dnm_099940 [Desulfonema magnum]
MLQILLNHLQNCSTAKCKPTNEGFLNFFFIYKTDPPKFWKGLKFLTLETGKYN